MNLRPRKLTAAHALLVDLLAAGPMPVASCITAALDAGLSTRTLFEARRRLPVECDRTGDGPGWWRLVGTASPPAEWNRRRLWFCRTCGRELVGEHWRRRRCRQCGGR